MTATTAADAAIQMAYASQVIVVPGYGMAVAQAQHAVKDMAKLLEAQRRRGQVRHPPRGRPDARAHERAARRGRRPYDALKEMDEINDEFPRTDVALVIGANDVTNPAARNDPARRSTACRSSTSTTAAR